MHIIDAVNTAKGDANMPYLDGTGPMGTGPYGRGMGPCRANGRISVRTGRGRRGGFGCQPYCWSKPWRQLTDAEIKRSMEAEIEVLEARLKYLKDQLKVEGTDSS
jgi:hypothetical protein